MSYRNRLNGRVLPNVSSSKSTITNAVSKKVSKNFGHPMAKGGAISTKIDTKNLEASIEQNRLNAEYDMYLDKGADFGGQTVKPRPLPRFPNALHKFESMNAVFTLCALTLDEVNFPDETIMRKAPKYVIAKSAGGSSRSTNLTEDTKLEFYVDNVVIDAIVHSNPATGHTQGTNISFNVHEPFSLGLFLQNIQFQVIQAAGTDKVNYLDYPMALIIEFKGSAVESLDRFESNQLRKVIPIQLKTVNFTSANGVSSYEVSAIALNDYAFSDQVSTLANDIEIKGKTVAEMLFEGEQSLAKILNQKAINEPSTQNVSAKKRYRHGDRTSTKKEKISSVRDYIFLFPNEEFNASEKIKKGTDELGQQLVTDTGDEGVQIGYSTRLQKTFNNLFNDLQYSIKDGFSGKQYQPNKIGSSKMITEYFTNARDSGKEFSDDGPNLIEYYDKETKTYRRGSAKIDPNTKSLAFKKGTSITKIIEDVILLSEYGQSISKRQAQSETGLIDWFKIVPSRYIFHNEQIKKRFNTNPDVIMYRILEYAVPDDKFMAADETSRLPGLDYLVRKQYDILYTGKNKDVIDFNVEFNNAFFTAIQNDLGNNTPDSKDSSTSSVKKNKKEVSLKTSQNPYNTNNPSLGFGDPSNRDGGDAETIELRLARQFNEAILNSDVDLIKITLQIVGDPYYIPQSGLGNYIARGVYYIGDSKELFLDGDANANFLKNIVLTKINFRTPIDIDGEGKMAFTKEVAEDKLQTLGEFSGFYYPIKVNSSFAGNKFVQELEMIRVKQGPQDVEPQRSVVDNVVEISDDGLSDPYMP